MEVGLMEAKPPYVSFEYRPVEDRAQSIAQGRPIYKDVAFAVVTPAGSKDRIPKPAEEWLQSIRDLARRDMYPALWVDHYSRAFEFWKSGEEIPDEGLSVKNWPIATPSEVKALLDQNVRTVEAVAQMNEETMARLGMGGRRLKDRAQEFLKAASGPGAQSAEVIALKAENERLKDTVKNLTESVEIMTSKVEDLLKQQKGAPIPQVSGPFAQVLSRPPVETPDIGDLLGGNSEEE